MDLTTYFILGLYWLGFTLICFTMLIWNKVSFFNSGLYAYSLFLIAHAIYEFPYQIYYTLSGLHPNSLVVYLTLSGYACILWFRWQFKGSVTKFMAFGVPLYVLLTYSLILLAMLHRMFILFPDEKSIYAYIRSVGWQNAFKIWMGDVVLTADYGMSLICWLTRITACAFTFDICKQVEKAGKIKSEEDIKRLNQEKADYRTLMKAKGHRFDGDVMKPKEALEDE